MLIDYHTHHERCGHAIGTLREYVEYAIKLGIDQLGVSDHLPVLHIAKDKILPGLAMDINELDSYVHEAIDLKKEYHKDIELKIGIEADYIKGYEETIKNLLAQYPFDYVIGSVHFLGEWDISDSRQLDGWKKKPVDNIYDEYYDAIIGLAQSGIYDIVGHFDVIKKYGFIPERDKSASITKALDAIKKADMAMEINPSGLVKKTKEIYPSPSIVKIAVNKGIPFTLGSDAHKPDNVHLNLNVGRELLKELGVNKLATFANRKRNMVTFV